MVSTKSSSRWLPVVVGGLLALAVLGLTDATYLTVEHYRSAIPPCSVTQGCETVLTSRYATILGVPIAAFGALFYLLMALVTVGYLDRRSPRTKYALVGLSSVALVVSIGLVYLQLQVLHAICLYCMTSATLTLILWLLSLAFFKLDAIRDHPGTLRE